MPRSGAPAPPSLPGAAPRSPPDEARGRSRELVGLLDAAPLAGLKHAFERHWWLFLLRGLLAVLFGVLALVQPVTAFAVLVLVFGAWAFVDGISAFALAVSGERSWLMLLVGLIGVGAGVLTFLRPDLAVVAVYALIAAWAITRGLLEIVLAVELRRQLRGELWYVLGGISSMVFGVLLIVLPAAGLLAVSWLLGIYALVFGVLLCALAFRLRDELRPTERARAPRLGESTPTPA